MGIFDKSNYIVNTGIIKQVFQCTDTVILLAKDEKCGCVLSERRSNKLNE